MTEAVEKFTATTTLDQVAVTLRNHHLRVTNLWQPKDGTWSANMRSWGGAHFTIASGLTIQEALQRAMNKAIGRVAASEAQVEQSRRSVNHDEIPFDPDPAAPETFETPADPEPPATAATDPDIDDLLG